MNQTQREFLLAQFQEFWEAYPMKVGKLAAEKAYLKARTIASHEAMLQGLAHYRETKPADRPWCYATTWLNQGRWLDEMPVPQRRVAGSLQKYWD